MMADIFISYSSKDPEVTRSLATDLERMGYSTWWDSHLLPGEEFPEVIETEVNRATVVIVIWTPDSVNSPWVREEAALANKQGKLITVCTETLEKSKIPLPFKNRHTVTVAEREKIYFAIRRYVDHHVNDDSLLPRGNVQLPAVISEAFTLKKTVDSVMQFAESLTSYFSTSSAVESYLDVIESSTSYLVRGSGDVSVNVVLYLKSFAESAHFYSYWIDGDPESDNVDLISGLNLEVIDLESGQALDWLPIRNDPVSKVFAIFFPEISVGKHKILNIRYSWPGYMNKLFKNGYIDFDWKSIARNSGSTCWTQTEWIFKDRMVPKTCEITGPKSGRASVELDTSAEAAVWRYKEPDAETNPSQKYTVRLKL